MDRLKQHNPPSLEISNFYETIFSDIGTGIIVFDKNLCYLAFNPFMEKLAGMKKEQVIGMYSLELFPHLIKEGVDKLILRALQGETVESGRVHFMVPSTGNHGWYRGKYSPLIDNNGEIAGVIAMIYEISSLIDKEIHLEQIITQMQILVEGSSQMILSIDKNGRIVETNARTEELLGFNREEFLRQPFRAFLTQSDIALYEQLDRNSISKGIPVDSQLHLRDKTGVLVKVRFRTSALRGPTGEIERTLYFFDPVNNEYFHTEQLSILTNAIETSVNAFFTLGDNEKINYFNTAFSSLFQYSSKETSELSISALIDTGEVKWNMIKQVLLKQGFWNGEVNLLNKDKHRFNGLCTFNLVHSKINNEMSITVFIQDITDRYEKEKKLRELSTLLQTEKRLLEEKNVALKTLINQLKENHNERLENVTSAIRRTVFPLFDRMMVAAHSVDRKYISLIRANLSDIIEQENNSKIDLHLKLSPKEIEVCNLIGNGLSVKDIAELLHLSPETISTHRRSIRRKLGLNKTKTSLKSYLDNYQQGNRY